MIYDDAQAWNTANEMGMTIYYVFLLKKGPTWSPDSTTEIDQLQTEHLDNLRRLGAEGKLVLNGPLLDSFQLSGEIRGIGVLKARSLDEAQEWISTDPYPDYHRQGIGRVLIEHARQLSPNHLWLYTHVVNTMARTFYEKNGFIAVKFGVSPPPELEPDVEYHWYPVK